MAFAEINIQEIIQEKKNNSEEFYNTWKKSEDEYRLIAEMIELRKQKGDITDTVGKNDWK